MDEADECEDFEYDGLLDYEALGCVPCEHLARNESEKGQSMSAKKIVLWCKKGHRITVPGCWRSYQDVET
jgi:hypothetical protein